MIHYSNKKGPTPTLPTRIIGNIIPLQKSFKREFDTHRIASDTWSQ